MSTIQANTIQSINGGDLTPCRAWLQANITGFATRGSGNMALVTDSGVGNFTVSFSTRMPDTAYAVVISDGIFTSAPSAASIRAFSIGSMTVSEFAVIVTDNNGDTAFDTTQINIAVFR